MNQKLLLTSKALRYLGLFSDGSIPEFLNTYSTEVISILLDVETDEIPLKTMKTVRHEPVFTADHSQNLCNSAPAGASFAGTERRY